MIYITLTITIFYWLDAFNVLLVNHILVTQLLVALIFFILFKYKSIQVMSKSVFLTILLFFCYFITTYWQLIFSYYGCFYNYLCFWSLINVRPFLTNHKRIYDCTQISAAKNYIHLRFLFMSTHSLNVYIFTNLIKWLES